MHWKTPGWVEQFVAVQAERALKDYAQRLIEQLNLSPNDLAYLAETNTPLSQFLALTGMQVAPIPGARDNPGGRYLLGLSSQELLGLLQEAIPAHAEVLGRFPEYSTQLTEELKHLLLG